MILKTMSLAGALFVVTGSVALAAPPPTSPGAENAATPATPATPADPSTGMSVTPATPATPAEPSAQANDPLSPDAQATMVEAKTEKPAKKTRKKSR
jgi:hypothetical protein